MRECILIVLFLSPGSYISTNESDVKVSNQIIKYHLIHKNIDDMNLIKYAFSVMLAYSFVVKV